MKKISPLSKYPAVGYNGIPVEPGILTAVDDALLF